MNELKTNPNITTIFEPKEGAVESVRVLAPIRGEGLRTTIVSKSDPEFFGALLQKRIADARGWPFQIPEKLQNRFQEAGLLVQENELSRPVNFSCDLNQDLLRFVPKRTPIVHPENLSTNLILNPSLDYIGDSATVATTNTKLFQAPLKMDANFTEKERHWYLVPEPAQYAPRLYSMSDDQHRILQSISPGGSVPSNGLDPSLLKIFCEAEIFVSPDYLQTIAARIQNRIQTCSNQLQSKRYTILPFLFHPFQLAALRRYYRALIEEGYLRFGDDKWPLRFYTPLDPVAHLYHQLAHPVFAAITGKELEPTFLFFASYRPGAELPVHRDREACEFSSSILLDFVPEPEDLSPWPLNVELLDPPGEIVPVYLGIGDMLLYYGRELRHYREPFKEGEASTTWLFFFQPVQS